VIKCEQEFKDVLAFSKQSILAKAALLEKELERSERWA
jgi:hypothetical protein